MIPVSDIIQQVRIEEKDVNEAKFSDWDIINAINKALRLMSNQLAQMNTDFMERTIRYDMGETWVGAELPKDFITVQRVERFNGSVLRPDTTVSTKHNTYHIKNNKLYAKGTVFMTYKAMLSTAEAGGELDVPPFLFDMIVASSRMIINNAERDVLTQYITEVSASLVPRRKYTHARTKMPFHI